MRRSSLPSRPSPFVLLCGLALLLAAPALASSERTETTGLRNERLAADPSSNLEDLGERLRLLGATESGWTRLEAALERAAGETALQSALHHLGLPGGRRAKAEELVATYRQGRPVALHGLQLPVEEQLFVDELLRLGYEPGAAAWLTMSARDQGWPESPSERERLRSSARLATDDLDLQDAALDAAVLRREAAELLSLGDEDGRRLPGGTQPGMGELPDAACVNCPAWNFGLFAPTDAWQTHSGSIESGECKVYRFAVASGQAYQFSLCEGGGSASFDSVLVANDMACVEVGRDDDTCGKASDVTAVSPYAGYMYVQVSANFGESGEYTLAFRKVDASGNEECRDCPHVDHAPAHPLPIWSTFDSAIGPGGCRIFNFPVQLGKSYSFTTCEPGSGGSASFDTVIESAIVSQACRPGPANDDACGTGSTVEFTADISQVIAIKVRGYDETQHGPFTLAFRETTGDCPDCGQATMETVMPDETVQHVEGFVPTGDGCDVLPVAVEAGKSYLFSACLADGGFSEFSMDMVALDASCNPIGDQDDGGCFGPLLLGLGGEPGRTLEFTPCYTGTAYIRIREAEGSSGGAWRLAYTEKCGWVGGCRGCNVQHGPFTPTTAWQTAGAFLPADGCRVLAFELEAYKTYRFSGCQGGGFIGGDQRVRFRVRRPNCGPCNPANAGECGGTSPRVDITPEVSGTYYLVVEETNGSSAPIQVAYREIRANCNNTDTDERISARESGTSCGTLTVKNGARLHEFDVTPGRQYRFTLCEFDSDGNHYYGGAEPGLDWLMVDMTGGPNPCMPDAASVLTNGDCGGELDIVGPPSGKIVIKVARRCGSPGGDYCMSYRDITPAIVFVSSGRYTGDMDGRRGPEGGDDICNELARAPGVHPSVAAARNSVWVAWLSDDFCSAWERLNGLPCGAPLVAPGGEPLAGGHQRTLSTRGPKERIGSGIPADGSANGGTQGGIGPTRPYALPDGTLVADDAFDLIDLDDLHHAIDMDQNGATLEANFPTWTGTDQWGDSTGLHCSSWTSGAPTQNGTQGRADMVDGRWTQQRTRVCERRNHIYCFETDIRP